jgi:AraC-like DNA-binding protein
LRKFFTLADPVVPMHNPRLLVETAAALGADREALLENVGITVAMLDQPDARISYAQFSVLERNALELTGDPALGLRFGRATRVSHTGVLGLAAMSMPNARAGFQLLSQYMALLNPAWELTLREEGERAFISYQSTLERGDLSRFATEAMVAGLYAMAEEALGRKLPVEKMSFSYPRPAHHELYREFIADVPFHFDQPANETEFHAAILDEPMVTADPMTATLAEQYCASEASRGAQVDGLAAQVRKILLERGGKRLTLEEVARALQTSPRSLRRALGQMNTSYQDIADSVLRARAEEQIRAGSMKVEHLAQELGFADARSFRRAFKRWTGQSPNDFRRGAGQR